MTPRYALLVIDAAGITCSATVIALAAGDPIIITIGALCTAITLGHARTLLRGDR
jgi:phosphohistidine swiveling domain-containing protein